MDISAQMILFANVVDHGNFSATARSLNLTPSAISKQIGQLEDRLGIRLLNRSTRSVTLTDEGRAFYERCAAIAANVVEAEALAVSLGDRPQGTLNVAATVAFGKFAILPALPEFLDRYPELHVKLELTDARIDFMETGHDLAIRFTEQLDDHAAVVRKLADNERLICASPAYIAAHGAPESLQDLANHNCLRISTVEHWNDWHFDQEGGESVFHAKGNFEANSADAVYHATLAGLGIARLSTYLIGPDLCAGRLVRVLPELSEHTSDILAVYPDRRNLSPKVRLFIDYLIERFYPVPPWDRRPEAKAA